MMLWIGQNLLLVASSILRTLDYIDVFTLTQLRIAALAWMLLVAAGLGLIWWRIVKDKSSRWLINANAASAGLMLSLLCAVDTEPSRPVGTSLMPGRWADGGRRSTFATCAGLGSSSLVPLAELEARTTDQEFLERVSYVRAAVMEDLERSQSFNADWSWRGARRLAKRRIVEPPSGRFRGRKIEAATGASSRSASKSRPLPRSRPS
jgi:hypothetical protein